MRSSGKRARSKYRVSQLAYFLDKMKTTMDGDQSRSRSRLRHLAREVVLELQHDPLAAAVLATAISIEKKFAFTM